MKVHCVRGIEDLKISEHGEPRPRRDGVFTKMVLGPGSSLLHEVDEKMHWKSAPATGNREIDSRLQDQKASSIKEEMQRAA